jgi:hypothetical protein
MHLTVGRDVVSLVKWNANALRTSELERDVSVHTVTGNTIERVGNDKRVARRKTTAATPNPSSVANGLRSSMPIDLPKVRPIRPEVATAALANIVAEAGVHHVAPESVVYLAGSGADEVVLHLDAQE